MIIELGTRRELFLDRRLIDRMDGTRLVLHRPRSGGVALCFDEPWARPGAGYGTVIEDAGTYRLTYRKTLAGNDTDDEDNGEVLDGNANEEHQRQQYRQRCQAGVE